MVCSIFYYLITITVVELNEKVNSLVNSNKHLNCCRSSDSCTHTARELLMLLATTAVAFV